MYPFLTLRNVKIYMTWVWIVIGLFTFIVASWFLCKKYKLDFRKLFYWFPTFLIVTYLLGSYSYLLIERGIWFPLSSLSNIKALLSPYGYKFHFVGVLIWIVRSMRRFFKKLVVWSDKLKWIDVFFFSITTALIPMGVFFVLGDTIIGKPAPFSSIGVSDLTAGGVSELSKFGKVFPVWIFLSIISLFAVGFTFAAKSITKKHGRGYIGFAVLLLLMNIVFIYQQYTRHGVISLGGQSFDIKNIIATLVGIICLLIGLRILHKKNN